MTSFMKEVYFSYEVPHLWRHTSSKRLHCNYQVDHYNYWAIITIIDLIITMIDDRLDNYNDGGHVGVLHCNDVSAL
jgi:hypothetical protein